MNNKPTYYLLVNEIRSRPGREGGIVSYLFNAVNDEAGQRWMAEEMAVRIGRIGDQPLVLKALGIRRVRK